MSEEDDLIAAWDDISSLIGALNQSREGNFDWEDSETLLNQIVREWNRKQRLIFFMGCVFNKLAHQHAKLAEYEGVTPEEKLLNDYRRIFGD